jgi:hypothetical protein
MERANIFQDSAKTSQEMNWIIQLCKSFEDEKISNSTSSNEFISEQVRLFHYIYGLTELQKF